MIKKAKNKEGVSLIFAIIISTALILVTLTLNEVILRNLDRVGEMEASLQAQSAANSAFEEALVWISGQCEGGCDEITEVVLEEDIVYGEYTISGQSGENAEEAPNDFYVPIPGYGDAGEDCDPDAPGDADDECNWNKIYYNEPVSIPMYVDGEVAFSGSEFYLKVRTPACIHDDEQDDTDCSAGTDRKLIACLDGSVVEAINGCDLADDPVVMTWQILGDRVGSSYVEGREEIGGMAGKRDLIEDSEIYTTQINDFLSDDYIVITIDDKYAPEDPTKPTIADIISEFEDPVLKLTFVQSISNSDNAIPYLEYQVITDVPISNDRSFISVIGYTEHQNETYYWTKEGSWASYSSSPINYAFQN